MTLVAKGLIFSVNGVEDQDQVPAASVTIAEEVG